MGKAAMAISVPTRSPSPAGAAARTTFRASLGLGLLAVGSLVLAVVRLLASWHITSAAGARHVTVLGQSFAYPSVNLAAIVIVALSALGLAAALVALHACARELVAARRAGRRLARLGLGLVHGARLIEDPHPHAFCAGLLRPRVYVSTGAVAMLGEPELAVVLAHERHHARRRDPLRLAVGRVLTRSLFFLPALGALASRHQSLAELGADEAAVADRPGLRPALARAMLSFLDAPAAPGSADRPAGVDPARVDHLLGEPVSCGFPLAVGLVALCVIAAVATTGVLAGRVAAGSASLSLPFLSAQPCVLMLALLPVTLGSAVVAGGRARRAADQ